MAARSLSPRNKGRETPVHPVSMYGMNRGQRAGHAGEGKVTSPTQVLCSQPPPLRPAKTTQGRDTSQGCTRSPGMTKQTTARARGPGHQRGPRVQFQEQLGVVGSGQRSRRNRERAAGRQEHRVRKNTQSLGPKAQFRPCARAELQDPGRAAKRTRPHQRRACKNLGGAFALGGHLTMQPREL